MAVTYTTSATPSAHQYSQHGASTSASRQPRTRPSASSGVRKPSAYQSNRRSDWSTPYARRKAQTGHTLSSSSKRSAASKSTPKQTAPVGKPKADPTAEKRLKQFRRAPTNDYLVKLQRAMDQTMYVLSRTRHQHHSASYGPQEIPAHESEELEIAGSTGNIYVVTVGRDLGCTCPSAAKDGYCKHIAYVMARTLKAPAEMRYQRALLTSELAELFANAPALPSPHPASQHSASASQHSTIASNHAGSNGVEKTGTSFARKPLDDDCPICCMPFEADAQDVLWCRAACGNNVHAACFRQWAALKGREGGMVTCPFCRSEWEQDPSATHAVQKNRGHRTREGYVNVADQLGMSTVRDTRSYYQYWVHVQSDLGRTWDDGPGGDY